MLATATTPAIDSAIERALAEARIVGAVVLVWASNVVVVKWGLARFAPLSRCAWRFVAAAIPGCLLVAPPRGRWALLACFGALTGLGQFGLLYVALRADITPGLASVICPTQAFFNVAFGALILREPVRRVQLLGCAIAATGLLLIVMGTRGSATIVGVALVLLSAMSWAVCNTILRRFRFEGDLLAFMIWMSPFAAAPLILLALVFEGGAELARPVAELDWSGAAIIAWQAYANSIIAYSIWNSFIRHYGLARVAPLALFVPVAALTMSAFWLDEVLGPPEMIGASLILLGVLLPALRSARTPKTLSDG